MDRHESREHRISQHRADVIRHYPALWQRMIADWTQPGAEDCAWLMYSANYLFRIKDVRWAVDPVRLEHRLAGAPSTDYVRDLDKLSFVLLTHEHNDHLDLPLIRLLSHLPIIWIVPEAIVARVMEQGGVSAEQIIMPKPLQSIEIRGIRIMPFEAMHWEMGREAEGGRPRGVPATGYLAEFNSRRWLFPGDTRTYDERLLPSFGPVDGLFAHIWLGRGCAEDRQPPLLEAFCRYCLNLKPRRVVLTHLHEFGRGLDDYWDEQHVEAIMSKIRELCPELEVASPVMGESISL